MATNTSVDITTSSTEILPANSGREVLIIQNIGNDNVFLSFGADAVVNKGYLLKSGTSITLSDEIDIELMTEGINGISSVGTNTLLLIYK